MTARLASLPWRSDGRMIWADEPVEKGGQLHPRIVGLMDSEPLAQEAVKAHNERLASALAVAVPK